MANYRNIATAFWTDSKIVDEFTPEDKFFYLYLLTNPHTNRCGCYEISVRQIASETGYSTDTVQQLLHRADEIHNVCRYNAPTKELLILNWHRFNWHDSEKINRALRSEIQKVKAPGFREYLIRLYNSRSGEEDSFVSDQPKPKKEKAPVERHKYGEYSWVRLSDAEYERLLADLGEEELKRCIRYVDENAQSNGNKNKWKDWNLVIRKCSRDGWGRRGARPSASAGAMDDLAALHRQFEEEGR